MPSAGHGDGGASPERRRRCGRPGSRASHLRLGGSLEIGVGRASCPGPPSLRTGLADLPHPALQSVVLPARGLMGLSIGREVGEQPVLSKEGIGPEMMVYTPTSSSLTLPVAEDASKAHSHPLVQGLKRSLVAVLEIFKPAPARGV